MMPHWASILSNGTRFKRQWPEPDSLGWQEYRYNEAVPY